MEDSPPRLHGFQRPFHPFQVVSWVVFGTDVLLYLTCILSLVDHSVKLILAPWYILTVFSLVAATAQATRCNAADRHVRFDDSALQEEEDDDLPFCGFCNVSVFPRSKHCRICCKCVDVFDHHCMWINNCVGRANYTSFFITIASVSLMIGTVLCTCAYLLIAYFADEDSFEKRLQETPVLSELSREFMLVLIILMSLLNLPLFILDCQLVVLHIFLMTQGLTTYEYIMNKRDALERTDGPADEEASPEKPVTPKKMQQRKGAVRFLPRCMDWIIFCNCGRRRRKRHAPDKAEGRDRACSSDNAPLAVQMGHPCNEDAFSPASSSSKGTRTPTSALEIPSSPELNHHNHKLNKIGLPKDAVIPRGYSKEPSSLPPVAAGTGPGQGGAAVATGAATSTSTTMATATAAMELDVAAETKLETRTFHCNLLGKECQQQTEAQHKHEPPALLQSLDGSACEGSQSSMSQEMTFAAEIDGMAAGSSFSSGEPGDNNDHNNIPNNNNNNNNHDDDDDDDDVDVAENSAAADGRAAERGLQQELAALKEGGGWSKKMEEASAASAAGCQQKDGDEEEEKKEKKEEKVEKEEPEEQSSAAGAIGAAAAASAGAVEGFAPPPRAASSSASRRKPKDEVDSIWQVGRHIITPTRVSLWEGPERTSLEVGIIPAGSKFLVREVHRGAHTSMRCAFVSVVAADAASGGGGGGGGSSMHDAGGQQGWVRCESVVIRSCDASTEDSSDKPSSKLAAASASTGGDASSTSSRGSGGTGNNSKPPKKKRQSSSSQRRKHGLNNLTESLFSTSPEDRAFDELPSPDRDFPCLSCGCGTAGRSSSYSKVGAGSDGSTEKEPRGGEAKSEQGRSSPRLNGEASEEKQQLLLPLQSNQSSSLHLPLQPGPGYNKSSNARSVNGNTGNTGSSGGGSGSGSGSGTTLPRSPRHAAPASTGAAAAAVTTPDSRPNQPSSNTTPSSASNNFVPASISGASILPPLNSNNDNNTNTKTNNSGSNTNGNTDSSSKGSSPNALGQSLHVEAPLHSVAAGLKQLPPSLAEAESE